MRYWLEDPDCRDQYSVIFESGDRTAIYWNDVKDPVTIEERPVSVWGKFLLIMLCVPAAVRSNTISVMKLNGLIDAQKRMIGT